MMGRAKNYNFACAATDGAPIILIVHAHERPKARARRHGNRPCVVYKQGAQDRSDDPPAPYL